MPLLKKDKSDRVREVVKVLRQIETFGFPKELEGIKKITKELKDWAMDGEYRKGRIRLRGYEREIHYELYTRKGTEIAVNLKFVKGL